MKSKDIKDIKSITLERATKYCIEAIKIKKRLVNLEPIVNKNSGFIDIKLPSRC